jgi:predicted dehydrogenase
MLAAMTAKTRIAFVGTGFVADYYMTTLANHPELELAGAYDSAPDALSRFCGFYKVKPYQSLQALLDDGSIKIVVNLTTPQSHYEVSRAALSAGKHIYSEKPLAMSVEEAESLVDQARQKGLIVASAPANALSPACETVKKALDDGLIGQPRLVYAQMEDGAVFRGKWRTWRSVSGAPWPGVHEFEIGCTLEHAGYALSWLVKLFGPATGLHAFSTLAFPGKAEGHADGPDYSVGSLTFANGAVVRLTSGLCAPKDRSLTIMGTGGTITVEDLWDYGSKIRIERTGQKRRFIERLVDRIEHHIGGTLPWRPKSGRILPVNGIRNTKLPAFPSQIDFCGGIAALADAIATGQQPFFSGAVSLHITELALALSGAGPAGVSYTPRSAFTPSADGTRPSRSPGARQGFHQAA